jgi:hypothetical protein
VAALEVDTQRVRRANGTGPRMTFDSMAPPRREAEGERQRPPTRRRKKSTRTESDPRAVLLGVPRVSDVSG